MKFRTGKKEREAKRRANYRAMIERYCGWHRWFAWIPIDVGNDEIIWLEIVERRFAYVDAYTLSPSNPIYRSI
jgi:hypothetical protein